MCNRLQLIFYKGWFSGMATIRSVAKLAGVSVATVSRVLNQRGYVHIETEKKVLKAIKELNYTPSIVARSLNNKKTNTIGLILPDITNPFFPELARAIEDVMQIYGYTVVLCNSDGSVEKEQEYIDILKQKYIDGIIISTSNFVIDQELFSQIPIVTLDRHVTSEKIPSVEGGNYEGAKLATEFLLSTGCKHIAHLQGPETIRNARERRDGYIDVLKAKGCFDGNLIVAADYDIKKATKVTFELLERDSSIDGIFAGNDLMAIGALKAIQMHGLRVPDDISVIGFDGIALGEMIYPELTTIAQPIYDMGAIAARILVKLIEEVPLESTHHKLDAQLVERRTTRRLST